MAAVVHHGGAGTVAAGLRFGKPTFVCPFFGDQHFWGAQVHQSGVGPPPCPIVNLTTETLVAAFASLVDEDIKQVRCIRVEKQSTTNQGKPRQPTTAMNF